MLPSHKGNNCFIMPINIFSSQCEKKKNTDQHCLYYAPNFEEVDGAYWFRVVRPCVRVSVRHTFLMHAISYKSCMLGFWNSIYGFLMEKICDPYFFSSPEPKAHRWDDSIGRHPSSIRPFVFVCRRQHFQTTSPLKPWSRFLLNFTYSIYRPEERIIVFLFQ